MKVPDVVVVTGGASGIGRALCRRFAQEGAKGVTVADMDEAGVKAVTGGFQVCEGFACNISKDNR